MNADRTADRVSCIARHLDFVTSLGADCAVDYTAEDFMQIGETFDFVFDTVGKTTNFRCRQLPKPEKAFAATDSGPGARTFCSRSGQRSPGSHRVIVLLPQSGKAKAFVGFLKIRMEAGEFRPVIDREHPLEDIADAYRYVETEQETWIVVINVRSVGANARGPLVRLR